ncbi:MAG: hypothetical protein MUP90_00240 [Gammaproteobacteria bacterium]|nr:hypothetical protein [Gammaproteobacteria bacterium]
MNREQKSWGFKGFVTAALAAAMVTPVYFAVVMSAGSHGIDEYPVLNGFQARGGVDLCVGVVHV